MTAGLGYDFLLMRLDDNGARDPSFGTNGVVTTRFPASTGNNLGRRLVLQPDGKIVLVGSRAPVGAIDQCGIARFNANGTLDTGFGTGGQVLVPVSVGCFNVSQQTDGKLVIVGNDKVGDVNYGTFIRLLRTGALDAGFGNGGLLDISSFGTPTRVAFTSGGNLVTGLTIQDPADGVLKSYVVELTTTLTGPWVAQTITLRRASRPDVRRSVPGVRHGELGIAGVVRGERGLRGRPATSCRSPGLGSCTITANQAGDAT